MNLINIKEEIKIKNIRMRVEEELLTLSKETNVLCLDATAILSE